MIDQEAGSTLFSLTDYMQVLLLGEDGNKSITHTSKSCYDCKHIC